ncbi:MAG: hypothetical protein AAB804_01650 [Patescibacteria group bacterium]
MAKKIGLLFACCLLGIGMFGMLLGLVLAFGEHFDLLLMALFAFGIPFAVYMRRSLGVQPASTQEGNMQETTMTPAVPEPKIEMQRQPAPTGAKRKRSTMYPNISAGGILNRLLVMLLSAAACAVVGYYIYQLIWIGSFPDLGLQVPWQGQVKAIQPSLYPLLLLAAWLLLERAAAHANPGHGWLWGFDFFPSAALFVWLVLTGFKLFMDEIKFSDPTHLWIYVAFVGSALGVAYYNFRHWFKESVKAPEDQVATTQMIADAMREVMGTHSITLYPRPGFDIFPERAFVARSGVVKLETPAKTA